MHTDIITSLEALREKLCQRLAEYPEYRALMALDRSIAEIGDIFRAEQMAPALPSSPAFQASSHDFHDFSAPLPAAVSTAGNGTVAVLQNEGVAPEAPRLHSVSSPSLVNLVTPATHPATNSAALEALAMKAVQSVTTARTSPHPLFTPAGAARVTQLSRT